MDITSFETSKRLKAAGFPQPEKAPGQFWYDEHGKLCVIRENQGMLTSVWLSAPMEASLNIVGIAMFYAASATDIMRHLPDGLPLQFQNGHFRLAGQKHNNPAEAAAAEYLQLRENEK